MAKNCNKTSSELEDAFLNASSYVKSLTPKLSNEQMLEFYGLYKQATEGPCTKSKPSWYELSEKLKWEAWSSLKNLDSAKAMEQYINLLDSIDPKWNENSNKEEDNRGRTLNVWVHHSCMINEEEVIKDSNKTIFDWVKEKNLNQVKECSINISEVNKIDDNGLSLLHWASDRGSLEIVKYLVEHLHADINVKDINGQTPLHYAVSCDYEDVAKYLIGAGADVNLTDNDGQTPYEAKC